MHEQQRRRGDRVCLIAFICDRERGVDAKNKTN
jgi:hypothetical protein